MLAKNFDVFAWTIADMSDIDPRIIFHKLSVCKEAKSVAQKKRRMGEEKTLIAEQEVRKLLDVKFIGRYITLPD